ncbi:MAG: penicillin acylase family protein, partial [Ardenticatenaceae bacterium]
GPAGRKSVAPSVRRGVRCLKIEKRDEMVWNKRYFFLLGVFFLLVISPLAGGRWWITRAFPQTSGTLQLDGLDGVVEIRRDEGGVPHIYATTLHDLYFAQGVVHAQDRLWQMDFQRRAGLGRLSELFGEQTIEADRFVRTIGTHLSAQQDWEALKGQARGTPIEAQAVLEAYAEGVNAYMGTRDTPLELGGLQTPLLELPLEYQLLDVGWEAWEPVHSLAWGKMMQWELSGNWEEELLRARLIERVGAEDMGLLLGDRAVVGTNVSRNIGSPNLEALAAILKPVGINLSNSVGARGSNSWAVAGTRTETGRPILANDPHLGAGMPSVWYEVGLHAPGIDLVGASWPGGPMVVIGHNAHLAWGLTNLGTDTQDLFIERLNPAGDAYQWKGQMVPLTVRREVIEVKDGQEVVVEVKETRHGPLINEVLEGLEVPIAFQWGATAAPSHLVEAILGLNFAQNREQSLAALRLWDSPPQNVIIADKQGDIAYVATGDLPIRPAAGGMLPQPGWDGEWEWQGMVPFDELPQQWNPAQGIIVTANQNPFGHDFPYYTGTGWAEASRTRRITAQLSHKTPLTLDDIAAIQRDMTSLPAQQLVPLLLNLSSDDIIVQRAQEQLSQWRDEYQMAGELPGAAIYVVTRGFVLRDLLRDELGADEMGSQLLDEYLSYYDDHTVLLSQLLDEPTHPLWDDIRTPQQESRDDILLRALEEMTDWLGRRFGDVPHEWFWKRLHTVTFEHPIARSFAHRGRDASSPILSTNLNANYTYYIFNRVTDTGGDGSTVNATAFSYAHDYAATSIPTYRQIVDVGVWENSRMLHTTGQSGQPFHPHYDDMIDSWRRADLSPMLWTQEQTHTASEERVLKLLP